MIIPAYYKTSPANKKQLWMEQVTVNFYYLEYIDLGIFMYSDSIKTYL